jgi:cytochrome d ubiquinol oxidase subunit I
MDTLLLSRLQFALTIAFHYIFPPLSIGLGLILVIMEGTYLRTRNELYHAMTHFWVKIFGLIFAIGVASGIVMEFQFGTNWSVYSSYVGDVFGSALAAEGIFAFFLESGFMALLLFGWNKVSRGMHFFATVMVALGSTFSAIWIIVANSWQQTPAGHHIVAHGTGTRAEIVDFWTVVFNPSTINRLSHAIMGCWQAGALLVVSVSAFYLLRGKHQAFARASIRIALWVALVGAVGQLVTGHASARQVAATQPTKLAAFEGHYPSSAPADMYLLGWVDEHREQVSGLKLPGMLSWLVHGDAEKPVTGLQAFKPEDRPPVNIVFQSYHLMVGIGLALIGISALSLLMHWRGSLYRRRFMLKLLVVSVLLPQLANQLGWLTAEVGRQPWIVYGLLRTAEAVSPGVSAGEVLASLIMFSMVYLLLLALFIFLLDHEIKHGPVEDDLAAQGEVQP